MIGAALFEFFSAQGWRVQATTRRRDCIDAAHPFLDLAAPSLNLPAADLVVLAAAVARIGDCESQPEATQRINVDGTLNVARHMAGQGSHILLLSSDKVFDGAIPLRRRSDQPCPACAYGEQKAAAEAGVLALGDRGAVLRLSKVLEPGLGLLTGWARDLEAGKPITPFRDLYLAPVRVATVARIAAYIGNERAAGIYHYTGAEDRSYVDLARILVTGMGRDPDLIQPTSCEAANLPAAARPRHTTLEMTVEQARWGLTAPLFEVTANDVIGCLG
jgi:dTDP-4-dehydrorhamnose reductase